ncbi:MAG: imidazole glycerol phosphate synthase subunit HisH [Candidatus Omnitrophica bacterium]|nr:imidazole glycerol phosphate synthase subunit HisH [Candidatus Omnitrophota bacterium]MCB9721787.1 imidazole glycerol phosphate synthase subunit HisH [Candidatus Omnitrophota bacterium]
MIAVIDYGMGNLRSVQKALEKVGAQARITDNAQEVRTAAKIVLPGVGAMAPAMTRLRELGLTDALRAAVDGGAPLLGICLGYQLLFDRSDEGGNSDGLGMIKGHVKRFTHGKVPHMGWNQLHIRQEDCPLFKNVAEGSEVYFCHSYYVDPADGRDVAAATDYGIDFASAICRGHVYGLQFHPEKSQTVGLCILKNFVEAVS